MRQSTKIAGALKICFFACFIFADTFVATYAVNNLWDPPNESEHLLHDLMQVVYAVSLGLFFWCILSTLIVRLYITFKPSEHRMSTRLIVMFGILMISIFILNIAAATLGAFHSSFATAYYGL